MKPSGSMVAISPPKKQRRVSDDVAERQGSSLTETKQPPHLPAIEAADATTGPVGGKHQQRISIDFLAGGVVGPNVPDPAPRGRRPPVKIAIALRPALPMAHRTRPSGSPSGQREVKLTTSPD